MYLKNLKNESSNKIKSKPFIFTERVLQFFSPHYCQSFFIRVSLLKEIKYYIGQGIGQLRYSEHYLYLLQTICERRERAKKNQIQLHSKGSDFNLITLINIGPHIERKLFWTV